MARTIGKEALADEVMVKLEKELQLVLMGGPSSWLTPYWTDRTVTEQDADMTLRAIHEKEGFDWGAEYVASKNRVCTALLEWLDFLGA